MKTAKFTRRHLTARVLTDILAQHAGFEVHSRSGYVYVYAGDPWGPFSEEVWEQTRLLTAELVKGLAHFANLSVYSPRLALIHLDFSGIEL